MNGLYGREWERRSDDWEGVNIERAPSGTGEAGAGEGRDFGRAR